MTFENLPASFAWQELKDLCKPYGRVIRADVNRETAAGTAVFETAADAQSAVDALQGSDVGGSTVAVTLDGCVANASFLRDRIFHTSRVVTLPMCPPSAALSRTPPPAPFHFALTGVATQ